MGNSKQKPDHTWVTINTDASFHPVHMNGGYGIWIRGDDLLIKRGGKFKDKITDANEAEIKAVLIAFYLLEKVPKEIKTVVINCDNSVVRNIINNRNIPKRFKILGDTLIQGTKRYDLVYAKHIKGHTNNPAARNIVNKWCDEQSKQYRKISNSEK